jgi:uncharacterized protein (DUF4415 family)
MPNLEYSASIPKCHRLLLELPRCERNDLEKYCCKDCNFETDFVVILKQHRRGYHKKGTDCVQDQPKNNTEVKSYICQKCSFETYSSLLWIKHFDGSCFDTEENCETVDVVSCSGETSYRCEYSCFSTKEATDLKKRQTVRHPYHREEGSPCFHCKYKGKTKNHLREHVNYKYTTSEAVHWFRCNECQFISKRYLELRIHKKLHNSADAVQWYNCDKCEFKTKRIRYLQQHRKNHLSADAVKWCRCDKCEFKTKRNDNLKRHKKIHLSADAVHWYSCDKCEYKTKHNVNLKQHQKIHLSADAVQWHSCDKCEFKTKYKK